VLTIFPAVEDGTKDIELDVTASNLHLKTRAGQELKPIDNAETGYEHEVNQEDNVKKDKITRYSPGSLTKGNSFNGVVVDSTTGDPKNHPNSTTESYLGTSYWETSYDCSAFAGDKIWIVSYGMQSAGSDEHTTAMNLLQLFDSRALRIGHGVEDNSLNSKTYEDEPRLYQDVRKGQTPEQEEAEKGTHTFLYAGDPDYPDGYDTNEPDVLAHMNSVKEEDLVYSRDLPDKDGNITVDGKKLKCIGVLLELRNSNLLSGKYQYMRIPVTVNAEDVDLVGKTIATVNMVRVWTEKGAMIDREGKPVTWANGKWDGQKNNLYIDGELYEFKPNGEEGKWCGEITNDRSVDGKQDLFYVKTEYKDGLQVSGTHKGGTLAGNSLLILSYKANINIQVDKDGYDPNKDKDDITKLTYNLDDNETVVTYMLKNIEAKTPDVTHQTDVPTTKLSIKTVVDDDGKGVPQNHAGITNSSFRMEVGGTTVSLPMGVETPVTFTGSDRREYTIYVTANMEGSGTVIFDIREAPIGIMLPPILFEAVLDKTQLKNNDRIKTSTYISGDGDNRAYNQVEGNTDHITIAVSQTAGSSISKEIEQKYVELNGTITYTVTYTNNSKEAIPTIYFYDLMPSNGDIRESHFSGGVALRWVDVELVPPNKAPAGDPQEPAEDPDASDDPSAVPASPNIEIFYSTMEYNKLHEIVRVFGGTEDAAGEISNMNAGVIEKMLTSDEDKTFTKLAELGKNGEIKFVGDFENVQEHEGAIEELSKITGLYMRVRNLPANNKVVSQIILKPENGANGEKTQPGDVFANLANSWKVGDQKKLPSNKVDATVIAREISGRLWFDKDLNGRRDEGEPLLQGVQATLFKKDGDTYKICTEDICGDAFGTVTTGKDGAYSFGRLAAGEYIVAFSGGELEKYSGATDWKKSGVALTNNSDGIANDVNIDGISKEKYPYIIKYDANTAVQLSELDKIISNPNLLKNSVERKNDLDLGLVLTQKYELPATGGPGALPSVAGALLCLGACLLLQKRKEK